MAFDTNEQLGPIDYLLVEFPGNKFNGAMAPALMDLVERGLVRILDLVFIKKDEDGTVTAIELEDLGIEETGALDTLSADVAELVSEADIEAVADAMEPGTSGGFIVWENTWAAPFANAVLESGGQVVATGRIPLTDVLAALEADEEAEG